MTPANLLEGYDFNNLTIAALGGHSALEVCLGAKKQGLRTVVIARKDRAQTYAKHLKYDANTETGCVDEVIEVENFDDILRPEIQAQLRAMNALFVHSRYFWVYFKDFSKVENEFNVPILGTRKLLRLEERDESPNQYDVLREAGIRLPRIFEVPKLNIKKVFDPELIINIPDDCFNNEAEQKEQEELMREEAMRKVVEFSNLNQCFCELHPEIEDPDDEEKYHKHNPKCFKMNCLTLTKVNNATRTYERENFVASNWTEWLEIVNRKFRNHEITIEDVQNATIEEFILGAQVNFNFFYSPLSQRLELLGTDTRRQTNLDGWLRLPANEQLKLSAAGVQPSHIETGHIAVTVKESLLEKAFEAGEKFVAACQKYDPRGIMGPFALQGAIETDGKKEELVVFDVSFRMPGSPGIAATPYSQYLFGRSVSLGERIGMEVNAARMTGKLDAIIS